MSWVNKTTTRSYIGRRMSRATGSIYTTFLTIYVDLTDMGDIISKINRVDRHRYDILCFMCVGVFVCLFYNYIRIIYLCNYTN